MKIYQDSHLGQKCYVKKILNKLYTTRVEARNQSFMAS